MKTNFLIIALLCICTFSNSQEIEGSWIGELDIQGMKLPVIFNIHKESDGYKTTMDSPKQGAKGIAVEKTIYQENELILDATNLGVQYKGSFSNDSIKGTFTQGRMELPLNMARNVEENMFVLNRPQTPKAPFNYPTEEVSFENPIDKNMLAGTICLPKDKKEFPILVMITGSGSQNRNEELFGHQPFAVIADDFAKKGIATLRMDDRGVGGSNKTTENPTTANFATDIDAAVEFLSQKGYKNIGLIGHSEGGMIAPMVAASNKKVRFIISMAGPGIKIEELMLMQIEKAGLLAGENPEKVKLDVELSRKAFNLVKEYKGKELSKEMESLYRTELNRYPSNLLDKNTVEDMVKAEAKSFTSPWFLYFLPFNPQDYLAKVKVPVLAINGSKDFQVDAKTNLEGFRATLKKAGNKNFEIIEFEGLNHLFQECNTGAFAEYSDIEQTISPTVLDAMSNWILKL